METEIFVCKPHPNGHEKISLKEFLLNELEKRKLQNFISFLISPFPYEGISVRIEINQTDKLITPSTRNKPIFTLAAKIARERLGGIKDSRRPMPNTITEVRQPLNYIKFEEILPLIVEFYNNFIC